MTRLSLSSLLAGLLCLAGTADAGYVQVESFDGLTLGAISGQNQWYASSGLNVAVDPADPANQVLQVGSQAALARKAMVAPQGTSRMVFLRFRFEQQLSGSFGMSHATAPSEFSDFGPEMNLINSQPDLRTANGDTPGVYEALTALTAGRWYNLWLQVDTSADTIRVWLNDTPGAAASAENLLTNQDGEELFGFRTSTSTDLKSFYIKTGSGGSGDFGPLLLDDLYIESTTTLNLMNPSNPLPGDYNRDGVVDLADYTVWRDTLGSTTALAADGDDSGSVDRADYDLWKANFGLPTTTGLRVSAVPVPGSLSLTLLAAFLLRLFELKPIIGK